MKEQRKTEEGGGRDERAEALRRVIALATKVEGLEGSTAKDVFNPHSEQGRRELIEHLSGNQYCKLLAGINGILRGKEKNEWDADGGGVAAEGGVFEGKHIFPHEIHKKELIVKSWEAAVIMNAEKRELLDIAMLLGSLLVETHPFADGNGRTSRLVYTMIAEGYVPDRLKILLSENGREELDTALMKADIDNLFSKKLRDSAYNVHEIDDCGASEENFAGFSALHFPEGVESETKGAIIDGCKSDGLVFLVGLVSFLHKHPDMQIETCIKAFGERRVLLLENLFSVMGKTGLEELTSAYWDAKKEYTEGIIDVFVHPDKPEYRVTEKGEEMTMLEYFKERIRRKEMLY